MRRRLHGLQRLRRVSRPTRGRSHRRGRPPFGQGLGDHREGRGRDRIRAAPVGQDSLSGGCRCGGCGTDARDTREVSLLCEQGFGFVIEPGRLVAPPHFGQHGSECDPRVGPGVQHVRRVRERERLTSERLGAGIAAARQDQRARLADQHLSDHVVGRARLVGDRRPVPGLVVTPELVQRQRSLRCSGREPAPLAERLELGATA